MIPKNPLHGAGTNGKKVSTTFEDDLMSIQQTRIGFIDQDGGLKFVIRASSRPIAMCDAVQLLEDERLRVIHSFPLPASPGRSNCVTSFVVVTSRMARPTLVNTARFKRNTAATGANPIPERHRTISRKR